MKLRELKRHTEGEHAPEYFAARYLPEFAALTEWGMFPEAARSVAELASGFARKAISAGAVARGCLAKVAKLAEKEAASEIAKMHYSAIDEIASAFDQAKRTEALEIEYMYAYTATFCVVLKSI